MARENNGFWSDFQKFISQGSVVELAIAVVIGGAFGKIISSLVEDILTPAILAPALKAAGVDQLQNLTYNGIKYGVFLASILNFFVIAFCLFVIIRSLEKTKRRFSRQQAIEEAATGPDPIAVQQQTADALNRLSNALESRGL